MDETDTVLPGRRAYEERAGYRPDKTAQGNPFGRLVGTGRGSEAALTGRRRRRHLRSPADTSASACSGTIGVACPAGSASSR
ncbi:MAG TPA: hypothetical protein VMV92_44255 [Streptosporangiaceae bacterium]|nr:hypothetical protein [Streptosporangiaceae bacterium]